METTTLIREKEKKMQRAQTQQRQPKEKASKRLRQYVSSSTYIFFFTMYSK